ncbi:signal recognition particle-docking protein FtsY [Xenorhabdus sp. KK7.4]|uniref:signal recognition particle-docking protein FtsY n=1 Tax=Xenorhabdus sp. KK7.4 TaxID=1851572 RepID=UPI000C0426E3|nr:signal recognition particle-docking protein FtsY [Xenorhabdus sp. KK7.4]PHM51963.1 signal recognition particle receptor FtsY [Xenorhabdus sp. KK7.4]
MAKEKKRGFFSWFGLGRQEKKQQEEQIEQEKLAAAEAEQQRLAEEVARQAAAEAEQQRLAEEAARQAAAEAEQQRLAEEAARQAAAEAEQQRLAEEAARQAAAEAEQQRLAEEAARQAAAEAEQQRLAEEAARQAAAEAEQQRLAEEATRQAAAEAEQQRLAEEAARQAAAEAEQQRLAEEAARQAAVEAEQQRLVEEAARQAAAEAEQQRLAEEAARQVAAEAEQQRLAEEAARQAAAEAEQQRLAEEAARQVAAEAEQQRLAEEAARQAAAEAEQQRLAEEAARQTAAEAEQQRLAEEAARQAAAEAEQQRLAEEAARQAAAEAEQQRLAEEAARQAEEQASLPKEQERPTKEGFFARLKKSLVKTRQNLGAGFLGLFRGKKIDDDLFEELEEQLLIADVGVETTRKIINNLTTHASRKELKDAEALYIKLKEEMSGILAKVDKPLEVEGKSPYVILMVGVNGVGKTTTIGKLARQYQSQGKTVMLAAGDTFRAAAVEQLQVWGERNKIPVVAQHTGADPASVIFDAIQSAKAKGVDVLIADTAGRLQNKAHLMEELKKIVRVMKKLDEEAPHEIMLTLDASTGQNAVSQAKLFHEAVGLTGISLTKLDGTAKGGVIFAIADQFEIPIRYIGVGEGIEDLRPFKADDFIEALFTRED